MDTLDFLQRVLPPNGNYCAWVASGGDGKPKQRFFSGLQDLADFLKILSDQGLNVYYAVSSFGEERTRKSHNVQSTKLFALDIDVGKVANSYSNPREALTAVRDFISTSGLPKPMIVSSGAGFHVYWVLTEAITPDVWLPIATGLKQAATKAGLVIDPTVTADLSRVLRPVGCMHQGKQEVVKLLLDAEPVDVSVFDDLIIAPVQLAPRKHTLLDNIKVTVEHPSSEAGIVANKCKQIRWGVDHQAEVNEPFWYAMMGVAAYTTNPEEAAIAWSENHPAFTERTTLEKVEQWKRSATGPALCSRFEAARPGGCKGCKFADSVNTPARLGAQYEKVELDAATVDPVALEIAIPPPFKRTSSGIKMTNDDVDVDICDFDIYPVSYGQDESLGYEVLRFKINKQHTGWDTLVFRASLLVDGNRDFGTVMSDKGITLPGGKKKTELFQYMLRNYMHELKRVKALTNIHQTMGWKDDDKQFVIGDSIIRHDESGQVIEEHIPLAKGTTRIGSDMYGVSGTVDAWSNGTSVLEKAGMHGHMFALGMGFAAPLFAFTGLKGMTVSLYGPTGGGKTLAQHWIQSIYGKPEKLHFAAKFTQNSLFNRLSIYANLPMTIDEATMFADKDVSDFLYWVSQGQDKARLSRSAEEREAKTWATPVIVSTNMSLQSKLVSLGLDVRAQMARLLEVTIPTHRLFSDGSEAGKKMFDHVGSNYGFVGREYLKELVRIGPDGIRTMIDEARSRFPKEYKASFKGHERFWEQAVILQDLGSSIAKRLGLISYDYKLGTHWVLSQLGKIRDTVKEAETDAFDLLSEYLADSADASVTVITTGAQKFVDFNRLPRGEVRVRYDLYRPSIKSKFTKGVLYVANGHFRKWLSLTAGYDYRTFMEEIKENNAIATPKSGKLYLAKDTPIKLGQMTVIGFDLTHPKFEGILNDIEEIQEQSNIHKLALVSTEQEDGSIEETNTGRN